jgi:integrase
VSTRTLRTPSYRHHKPSGQGVVTIDGRDFYLGRFGSAESRAEYDRLVAEWLTNGRRLPAPASPSGSDRTVNEMLLDYLRHADSYYVKNGKPTVEPGNIRLAIRPLRQLYGHTPARDFGPLGLKAVRKAMIDAGLCRSEINRRIGRVVRAFKWAVSEEIIPPSVHQALEAVNGLRRGRADVRESEPVKPVPDAFVDAIRPHVARQVWAMVELQRLTGMRPGEVTIMRTCDLDTSGRVWIFTPETHKTEHHGRVRKIYIGPQAQAILRPWLRTDLMAYLFSPRDAMEERR